MAERRIARRRLPPATRRAELLDAALEVFTELGFERATLHDVAVRAGVTKGAVYHYFESKDELFIELVRTRLDELVIAGDERIAAADPAASREAVLRDVLEQMWETLHQPHMIEFNRLVMMELPNFPEIGRAFFDEVVLPARRAMRRIWQREPIAPGDEMRVDVLVAAIPSMMFGVAMTRRMFAGLDPLKPDPATDGSVIVDALIGGAFARSRHQKGGE